MRIVDMSRDPYNRTPTYPGQPPIIHGIWKTHEEALAESGGVQGNSVMYFSMPDHGGTHIDAPRHFGKSGMLRSRDKGKTWTEEGMRADSGVLTHLGGDEYAIFDAYYPLHKGGDPCALAYRRGAAKVSNGRHFARLLRVHRERTHGRCAADERDELSPLQSIELHPLAQPTPGQHIALVRIASAPRRTARF